MPKLWLTLLSRYDRFILNHIEQFFRAHPLDGYIFQQDNAPSHNSIETKLNLLRRHIITIPWPPYSPDLNLIEHVWNWMKNWIQKHYYSLRYKVNRVPLGQLRHIIQSAWNAVPNAFIQTLFDSWWDRCQAVIDAKGGPTKY